jgi:hypothetical protein
VADKDSLRSSEASFGFFGGFEDLFKRVDGVEHLLHLGDEKLLVEDLVQIEVADLGTLAGRGVEDIAGLAG